MGTLQCHDFDFDIWTAVLMRALVLRPVEGQV